MTPALLVGIIVVGTLGYTFYRQRLYFTNNEFLLLDNKARALTLIRNIRTDLAELEKLWIS